MAIPRAQFDIRARDRSKGAFSSVRSSIRRVTGVATRLAGALGLVAGPAAFGLMIRQSLKVNDALAKTSETLGLTTEALSGLQRAAEKTGVPTRTLNLGIQRMTRRLAEAASGTGEAKDAIKELGVDAEKLVKLSPDEMLIRFAGAMEQVENQADKVRLGFKLFDSEAVRIINTLALGADGLRRMRREAEFLGIAVSRGDAAEIENFNDSLTDLKDAARGAANIITVELAKSLSDATRDFAFTVPIAIQKSIANVREMQSAYFDLGVTIQEVLLKRDEADKAILEFLPGGESFAEKFLGFDPDQVRKRREFLNHLKTERDFAAKQAEDALSAVGRLQKEREELLANPPVSKPQNVVEPGIEDVDASDKNQQERLRNRALALRKSLASEEEALRISLHEREVMLEDARIEGAITDQEHRELQLAAFADYQSRLTAIEKNALERREALERAHMQSNLNNTASLMGSLSDIVGSGSKKQFELSKQLARGQTIISTYAAAQKAFESQIIPGDPTSLGRATLAAAAAVAAGLARLTQINRASFGGGGGGSGGAQGTFNASPSTGLPRDAQQTFTRTDEGIRSPTTININLPEGADPQAFERWIENNRGTLMTTIQSEYDSRGAQGGPLR